jgi:hypothetical protein
MEELILNARSLLLYLVVMEYDETKSRLPHFLKTHLHARLVQHIRPIISYQRRRTTIGTKTGDFRLPSDNLARKEREKLLREINNFMWRHFSDQELDIIINHIIGGVPKTYIADRYNVSPTRIRQMQDQCLYRLKCFLKTQGVRAGSDI